MNKLTKYLTIRQLKQEKEQTEFDKKVWDIRRPLIETQNKIEEEQKELEIERRKIKFPALSKIFLMFLFLNFTVLELFIGWVTVKSFSLASNMGITPDFTPLITLISAVIGQTLSYGIYAAKSKAENTEGGITYEMAKMEMQQSIDNSEGGCG